MITAAVLPSFNEGDNLPAVLNKVQNYVDLVIVVDDGSKDTSYISSIQNQHNVTVIRHKINLGKGAALKTGCDVAVELGADIIVCLDADTQHPPELIPAFIEKITNGDAEIIFGARTFNSNMPLMMFLGNRLLSVIINLFFNVFIHDTQCGFRAFTRAAYKKIRWEGHGYEVETEMIAKVSENRLRFTEVNIPTIYLDAYKGTTALDGIKILIYILQLKFL